MKSRLTGRRAKLVAAAAAAAVLSSQALTMTSAQAATDVVIGVTPLALTAPAQYGVDAGVFQRNGLNASIRVFPVPGPGLVALAGGQVQFTYAQGPGIVSAVANGNMNLKIVAPADGVSRNDAARAKKDRAFADLADSTGMCVRPNAGINRWRDLEGKRIAVGGRGSITEFQIAEGIRKDGGDPKKVEYLVVGLPQAVAVLKRGDVDAAYVINPFKGQCKAEGFKIVENPTITMLPNGGILSFWVTTADFAANNPAVVKAFQKSIYEIQSGVQGNKAQLQKVLASSTKLTNQTLEQTLANYPPYWFSTITSREVAELQQISNQFAAAGLAPRAVEVRGLVLPQYRK